jgi:hypothetical protein
MDVKVDIRNILPGNHLALENAAIWLREHFNVPENETIFERFEENFNCRIDVDDRRDYWMQPNFVVFENTKELTAFLLKWA